MTKDLTDIGDGWADPGVHNDPLALREAVLRMGIVVGTGAVGD